jgi:hypothetical protein
MSDTHAFDFATQAWSQVHCMGLERAIPRTGHVGRFFGTLAYCQFIALGLSAIIGP